MTKKGASWATYTQKHAPLSCVPLSPHLLGEQLSVR